MLHINKSQLSEYCLAVMAGCLGKMVSFHHVNHGNLINPIALKKAKIVYNFGLSEGNRVEYQYFHETLYMSIYLNTFFLSFE